MNSALACIRTSALIGALLLLSAPFIVSCGGNKSSSNNGPLPATGTALASSQLLYVTGEIAGDRTQIFGYRIQDDGTLIPLSLPMLISPYCCHEAASAGSVLYVADFAGGMTAMSVDLPSGQLSAVPGSPFAGISASSSGSPVTCAGKFVYATNGFPGGIFAFAIGSNGALTPLPGSPFAGGPLPKRPMVDPLCTRLFVPNSPDEAINSTGGIIFSYSIDSATGKLTPVPGSPFTADSKLSNLFSGTIDSTGKFLYVTNPDSQSVLAFSISATGVITPVPGSPFAAGSKPDFVLPVIVFSRQFLYVANSGSNDISIFAIDNNTGALTAISRVAAGGGPSFLVSSRNFLYSLNSFSNDISGYAVNQDGTLRQIPTGLTAPPGYLPLSAAIVTGP